MVSKHSSVDGLDPDELGVTTTNQDSEGFSMKSCLLSWFCGIEQNKGEEREDDADARRIALLSTKESWLGKTVVEINLVVLIACGFFIWGFFA